MKRTILKDNRGQSLVEFVLVLPLVLLLIFAILSFGFLVYDKMIVVLAASQAADKAGELLNDETLTLEEKNAEIKLVANSFLNYGISKKNNDVDLVFDTDKVTVNVKFVYTFILPLLGDIIGKDKELEVKYGATYRIQ